MRVHALCLQPGDNVLHLEKWRSVISVEENPYGGILIRVSSGPRAWVPEPVSLKMVKEPDESVDALILRPPD